MISVHVVATEGGADFLLLLTGQHIVCTVPARDPNSSVVQSADSHTPSSIACITLVHLNCILK